MRRTRVTAALVLALLVALCAVGVAAAKPQTKSAQEVRNSEKLRRAVEPAGILVHQRRFQRIANANGGTRASGTPGYDASSDYVADKLRAAGYRVRVQTFEFPFYRQTGPASFSRTAPTATDYAEDTDFAVLDYSGDGTASGSVQAVDVNFANPAVITSGCEDADFAGFVAGNVALLQRGTCTFGEKVANAQEAGASAAIIANQGNAPDRTELFEGTLGTPVEIPAISVSFALGQELAQAGTAVTITTQTESENRETTNVLADTRKGRADRTVVVGGHLDSVIEGPGINDNGSGTATILETALQLAKIDRNPVNRLRFAFWGAEELGLLGSDYYVANLTEDQRDRIALNLNFDMVGSPNYVRFVYDGDGSSTDDPETPEVEGDGPAGSAEIEQTFNEYFASQGLETDPTAFDGRSDYGPFIAAGIPAGGLFSGAEGIKTEEQAAVYGGTAGVAYDPCYHLACDDISNLSIRALDELSDGVAHATYTYAEQRSLFNPNAKAAKTNAVKAYGKYKGPEARK